MYDTLSELKAPPDNTAKLNVDVDNVDAESEPFTIRELNLIAPLPVTLNIGPLLLLLYIMVILLT
jgi:hypothetical protein